MNRSHAIGFTTNRQSSHLEFVGAVLPLLVALATIVMVLLGGLLIGTGESQMDRLVLQNQLLVGLVCLLAIAVFGLSLRNIRDLRK